MRDHRRNQGERHCAIGGSFDFDERAVVRNQIGVANARDERIIGVHDARVRRFEVRAPSARRHAEKFREHRFAAQRALARARAGIESGNHRAARRDEAFDGRRDRVITHAMFGSTSTR